jgi:pimeloyl-ACP methyl ester carboxylesterase
MERWNHEHGMTVRRFGSGPDLVWIHGLGEWSVNFDAVAHHPAFTGFTNVLLDLPGCGRSPPPEERAGNSLDHLADRLADWLRPHAPAILVGHSMGGVLATMIGERIPVRAVVNIDGNLSRPDCTFSAQATSYSFHDFLAHGFDVIRADVYTRGHDDLALRSYHSALAAASSKAFWHNSFDLENVSITESLAARLVALPAPTLFVAGVPGGISERSLELLARAGARYVRIEPAGHWVFLDRPDEFARAVGHFLVEHCEKPRT